MNNAPEGENNGKSKSDSRTGALKTLQQHREEFVVRYGVTRICVFGSVARDEATERSDVDVVVEMSKPDVFFMVHIKNLLESAMHCHVDIVRYRNSMNGFLKQRTEHVPKMGAGRH